MESSREFLDSHPWVPSLVQKVTLSIHLPYDYSKPNIPLLDIIRLHLFTRLPNLRTWGMRGSISSSYWQTRPQTRLSLHRSTILCYRVYGGCIQNLELAGIPVQDVSHFVRLISAFTSLHSLTCSNVWLRKKHQTSLHDSEVSNFKLAKPLKIRHLSIDTSVDIRLVEYLLGSSLATLDSLAITFSKPLAPHAKDGETYFKRLEEATRRFSELSSLTLIVWCIDWWEEPNDPQSAVQYVRSSTRILKHVGRARLRDVRVEFELQPIASLGCSLSEGGSSLEACTALEESLLTFPASQVQFHGPEFYRRRRAGRPEFWSPTITSAFPKLNERGLLTFPCTRPSDPFGHEGYVSCLVASPDSKWIVTGSRDGTIIVWDAERGTTEQQWLAHRGPVYALGLSPDSRRLVSAGGESGETLVVWDISYGVSKAAALASIDAEKYWTTAVRICAWSPDGALIASACWDGTVHVWDALTFHQRGLLAVDDPEATNSLTLLQWSPDSRYLAWNSWISREDRLTYPQCQWTIWSPLAEEPPKRLPSHPTRPGDFSIWALAFDPQSRHIATALSRDVKNGDSEGVFEGDGSSDRHSESGYVQVWDVVSGTTFAVPGHTRGVHDISFSPDGRSLLSVSKDGLMKIWDTESWQEMASLEGDGSHWRPGAKAHFSPDGKYIATTFQNNFKYTVRLWRVGVASCAAVFTEHTVGIDHVAFSPNGEFLASGDVEGIVHIRRLSNFI
ncbi:WD40-repeat-containing domain protein [Ganoderma leucocontextum]|nr:WD40-repeat-containing domain protein [Ganoderma leucocontextum]